MKAWVNDPTILQAFKDEFLRLNPQYSDVQFFDCAVGGSAMLSASALRNAEASELPPEAAAAALDNYWYNEVTRTDGPLLDELEEQLASWAAGKDVLGVIWAQGEADTPYVRDLTAEVYMEGQAHVLGRLMELAGADDVFIQALGDRSGWSPSLHGGTDLIQQAQQEFAQRFDWVHLSTAVFDLPLVDTVHLTSDAYRIAAARMANAISTGVGSPTLEFGTMAADGKIYLSFNLADGQALASLTSAAGFRLADGTSMSIGAVTVDATAGVVILVPGTPSDRLSVQYATASFSHLLTGGDLLFAVGPTGTLPVHPFSLNLQKSGVAITRFKDGFRFDSSAAGEAVRGFNSDDHLFGHAGNDTLDGGAGLDRLYGGTGNDVYFVGDATDFVFEYGGEGLDQVYASVSHTLRSNVERLTLTGTEAITGRGNELANTITGNDGANKLYGLAGDDRLSGGLGNDTLDGGTGSDRLYGGAGDDTYIVDDATDRIIEYAGQGTDRVYASVSHFLAANVESLFLTGSSATNGYGNDSANAITGNVSANVLKGGVGEDRLYGGGGDDTINGESGNDWLEGGAGRDRYFGGMGADVFVFRDGDLASALRSSCDQIYDFSAAEGDCIRLTYIDANSIAAGDQAFAFIGTDAFSGSAGQLRYQQIGDNTYLSGDTDGDGIADFTIRVDGLHDLGRGDLLL